MILILILILYQITRKRSAARNYLDTRQRDHLSNNDLSAVLWVLLGHTHGLFRINYSVLNPSDGKINLILRVIADNKTSRLRLHNWKIL